MKSIAVSIVRARLLVIAAFVFATLQAGASIIAASSVKLVVGAETKHFTSGSMIPLRVSFLNSGKVPFCFVQSYPAYNTFLFTSTLNAAHTKVPPTSFGQKWSSRRAFLPTHWLPPVQVVAPGRKAEYLTKPVDGQIVPVGRFVDMTMPGIYRLRLITKYGMVDDVAGAVHTMAGYRNIGPHRFLLQDGFAFVAKRTSAAAQRLVIFVHSCSVPETISDVPLFKSHNQELSASGSRKSTTGLVLLPRYTLGAGGPRSVEVQLCNREGRPISVRITGNPFVDFRRVQVAGPDGLNGDHLVARPSPHYEPIPNWKEVPLTAYGKWLVKHRVSKGLKWKTYTLKPGVVYKYAVPVNLSCQFDMSLPGVYHVRLHLAGTKLKSGWVDVTVPP